MSIINDIKQTFRHGGTLTRLLLINIGVFAAFGLVRLVVFAAGYSTNHAYTHLLAVPADLRELLLHPWTLLTYMFYHEDLFHILFNMLWLWWFGQLFLQSHTERQLRGVYLLGGLSGAALFILAYNALPAFNPHGVLALGASASIMAVVFAVAVRHPNQPIGLLFIGTVRLKYLALATVLIDLVSIPASNAGGHIAHIGGALFGFAFARMLAKGRDISRLPLPRKHHAQNNSWPYGQQSQNKETRNEQQLNHILDKISRSGYNSLSRAEKKALFKFKDQTDA